MTYSTVRFGVYEEMKSRAGPNPAFSSLVAIALASGFVGGLAGNFADVVNVRMQQDSLLPADQRRNYKNAFDGVLRVLRGEGPSALFSGWLPGSVRASLMTVSQLACYDTTKRIIMTLTPLDDTVVTQLSASFLAGAVAATVSNPVDVIKTRMMAGSRQLGVLGVVKQISKQDGITWVLRGWTASFSRLGP